MTQLEALTALLIEANLVAAENIEAVVDSVQLYPACRQNMAGQLVVAEKHLNCTVFIAHYPIANVHENELFARLACWLMEFDGNNLRPRLVDIHVEMVDVYRCNLEFEVSFTEDILAEPKLTGSLLFNQHRYDLL